jgi:hypothetical protein
MKLDPLSLDSTWGQPWLENISVAKGRVTVDASWRDVGTTSGYRLKLSINEGKYLIFLIVSL